MPIVRLGLPEDSSQILDVLKSGFPPHLLPRTIYACKGIQGFLVDTLRWQRWGSNLFVVCAKEDIVVGFAEFRRLPQGLFLNHIYLREDARGKRLGRSLLREGIRLAGEQEEGSLGLHVFTENVRVRKWYASLGFELREELVWAEIPLNPPPRMNHDWWCASGMPQADKIQQVYGFSSFTLHTASRTYEMGRIGEKLFRSTSLDILQDACALGALATLDRGRHLLCLGAKKGEAVALARGGGILAHSLYLQASQVTVLEALREG